jgi:hypothetical protein
MEQWLICFPFYSAPDGSFLRRRYVRSDVTWGIGCDGLWEDESIAAWAIQIGVGWKDADTACDKGLIIAYGINSAQNAMMKCTSTFPNTFLSAY